MPELGKDKSQAMLTDGSLLLCDSTSMLLSLLDGVASFAAMALETSLFSTTLPSV